MPEILKAHIQKLIEIDEEELSSVLSYFHPLEVKKKQNLLTEDQTCQFNYFVANGCLRMFFINRKDQEQTVQFAIENWWLSDYTSFSTQKPAGFYIQAVEASSLLTISLLKQEELLKQHPVMERYFRLIHQRVHAASQFRIKMRYDLSREDLYHDFIKRHPGFVQRIPQYLLASYLGFSAEYLSEIRSKKRS